MAILLPDVLRSALADEIVRLRDVGHGVAWVAPENLHLTLKFLGHVEREGLTRVIAALAEAAAAGRPFDLALRGLGAFPTATRPRVVWAGVEAGHAEADALAGRVDAALTPLGFVAESRPFSAHVTLGRVREPRRDPPLTAAVAAGEKRSFGSFRVESVTLMRSDLSPRGARYTPLATLAFGSLRGSGPAHSLQGETGS